jgi:hypothetical protein
MSRCLFKHLKLPSCVKNRITGRQSAVVMYCSLHDVLFGSDVIFVSVEQTSDRGYGVFSAGQRVAAKAM